MPHHSTPPDALLRLLVLPLILLVCAALPATAQDTSTYRKVLFLGNSITKHGPKADIDWSGHWGMAAIAAVHLEALGKK